MEVYLLFIAHSAETTTGREPRHITAYTCSHSLRARGLEAVQHTAAHLLVEIVECLVHRTPGFGRWRMRIPAHEPPPQLLAQLLALLQRLGCAGADVVHACRVQALREAAAHT